MKHLRLYLIGATCIGFSLLGCKETRSPGEILRGTWVLYAVDSYPREKYSGNYLSFKQVEDKMNWSSPHVIRVDQGFDLVFLGHNKRPDWVCDYSLKQDSIIIREPSRPVRSIGMTFLALDTLELTHELQLAPDHTQADAHYWIVREYYRRKPEPKD